MAGVARLDAVEWVGFSNRILRHINRLGYIRQPLTPALMNKTGYLVVGPPKLDGLASQPWWIWTSGLYGAVIVVGMAFAVPNLGGAATVVLVVAGQVVASLAIDHFGVFGTAIAASPLRLLGAGLVAVGATLVLWVGR